MSTDKVQVVRTKRTGRVDALMTGKSADAVRGLRQGAMRIGNVADARRIAERRLPRVVFDYIDGGAEAEITMRGNREALEAVTFLPRMGVTQGNIDLKTTVMGHEVAMPVLLSPVGFTRMMHRTGDVAGASAAGKAGTIFTLSSMSGHSIEDVAAAGSGPKWFQLYFLGGRKGSEQLIDRAQRAGYSALVVTMDTQIPGNRERDYGNGLRLPLQVDASTMLRFAPRVALHPSWLLDFARDRFSLDIANATSLGDPDSPMSLGEATAGMVLFPPTWEDFEWMREQWKGPILAKGIITPDDARRAVDCGASGIIVSNHGGRQLDGMRATLPAMVEILEAVGDEVEVLFDGGVRRASDALRAIALGAKAAMIGRAWAYGLGAFGEAGIDRVLTIFRTELDRAMRLLGCLSIDALDRSYVEIPDSWVRSK